jgi:hypothetical protein
VRCSSCGRLASKVAHACVVLKALLSSLCLVRCCEHHRGSRATSALCPSDMSLSALELAKRSAQEQQARGVAAELAVCVCALLHAPPASRSCSFAKFARTTRLTWCSCRAGTCVFAACVLVRIALRWIRDLVFEELAALHYMSSFWSCLWSLRRSLTLRLQTKSPAAPCAEP